jgi:hypothetical protein
VAGCCECGDEPSGSCATELVSYIKLLFYLFFVWYKALFLALLKDHKYKVYETRVLKRTF